MARQIFNPVQPLDALTAAILALRSCVPLGRLARLSRSVLGRGGSRTNQERGRQRYRCLWGLSRGNHKILCQMCKHGVKCAGKGSRTWKCLKRAVESARRAREWRSFLVHTTVKVRHMTAALQGAGMVQFVWIARANCGFGGRRVLWGLADDSGVQRFEDFRQRQEDGRVRNGQFRCFVKAVGGAAEGFAFIRINQPDVLDTKGDVLVHTLADAF
jgi:hypothetical protein